MTDPDMTSEEYLRRVAGSALQLVWEDHPSARGVVVSVTAGSARCQRAAVRDFSLRVIEDAADPEVGGVGQGVFGTDLYSGLLKRQPDQRSFLIDPTPIADAGHPGLAGEWHAGPLPAPDAVEAHVWAEYGFARATETVVITEADDMIAFGCLVPFDPVVPEVGIYVMPGWRGRGVGRGVAAMLFDRVHRSGGSCHFITLAANHASQRLAQLGQIQIQTDVTTYLWE